MGLVGLKHRTEGFVDTCKTVGNVLPLSVDRAKNTLNMSPPSPLSAAVGCSHATFTFPLGSTAICGKAGDMEPEGATLTSVVKVLPASSERLKKMPSESLGAPGSGLPRSEEHTSELQSHV